jgi:hypothetical protein
VVLFSTYIQIPSQNLNQVTISSFQITSQLSVTRHLALDNWILTSQCKLATLLESVVCWMLRDSKQTGAMISLPIKLKSQDAVDPADYYCLFI